MTRLYAPSSKIYFVGVGDGGSRALDCLITEGVKPAQCIAVNTDKEALSLSKSEHHVLIPDNATHRRSGLGFPGAGRQAAVESKSIIYDALYPAQAVYIVSCMGGGTGTGATPVIAQIAREAKVKAIIAVVSRPFSFAGRRQIADQGIEVLKPEVDILIDVDFDQMRYIPLQDIESQQWYTLAINALAWRVLLDMM
jgi:cell division protein FtsZ